MQEETFSPLEAHPVGGEGAHARQRCLCFCYVPEGNIYFFSLFLHLSQEKKVKRFGLEGCASTAWVPIRPTSALTCRILTRNRHFEFTEASFSTPETDSQVLYEAEQAEEALWKPSPLMLPEDYSI